MKHLIRITDDGRLQPYWRPRTPWREVRRLAKAFRAFVEGVDPRDHAAGWYRFDVAEDGNAWIGSRVAVPRTLAEILLDTAPFVGPGVSIEVRP